MLQHTKRPIKLSLLHNVYHHLVGVFFLRDLLILSTLIFFPFEHVLQASGQATVTLSIMDQSSTPNTFKLVGNRLVTLRSLDFETQSLYSVTVIAVDSGHPPLSTSVAFSIQVKTCGLSSSSL